MAWIATTMSIGPVHRESDTRLGADTLIDQPARQPVHRRVQLAIGRASALEDHGDRIRVLRRGRIEERHRRLLPRDRMVGLVPLGQHRPSLVDVENVEIHDGCRRIGAEHDEHTQQTPDDGLHDVAVEDHRDSRPSEWSCSPNWALNESG